MAGRGSAPGERRGGRQKGVTNKATAKAREAIAQFVDGNSHRLEGWLDDVAAENPQEAFKLFMSVVEYHIPKLQRSEQHNSGEITINSVPKLDGKAAKALSDAAESEY